MFRSQTPNATSDPILAQHIEGCCVYEAKRMTAGLLKRILRWLCPHRFSWPHSGTHGHDYQICLLCGTTYEYDWTTMRRTRLISAEKS
jgi:hypothetical protein